MNMDTFLHRAGPHAPTGALSHPTVSRVFAKLKDTVPREKYQAFATCVPREKPKRRFHHKRRKLTEAPAAPAAPKAAPETIEETETEISTPREEVAVPGAKLFLFRDRPEILEAARSITQTNHHMSRQLNRLCEKRKILQKNYNKLTVLQRSAF